MYDTKGVETIATITELRSNTSSLVDHVQGTDEGVLIQKNNVPFVVLLSWSTYLKVKERLDLQDLVRGKVEG